MGLKYIGATPYHTFIWKEETMTYLKYKGPQCLLYTKGFSYLVYSESDIGWVIMDNQGVMTNVSKRNNLYWEEVK